MKFDYKIENIRNIGTAAHIDHGKTTFSDSRLSLGGQISKTLAGKKLMMDFDIQEQKRGITIRAAYSSNIIFKNNQQYLINLIDTPGHVDFSGDVTRAMRMIDGVFIMICAVEGIMPQTETVIKQALNELVKPILFINKFDRLINELKLSDTEILERIKKIINKFNELIYIKKFKVSLEKNEIIFGSAYQKWAFNYEVLKKQKISLKEFIKNIKKNILKPQFNLENVISEVIINLVPSPIESQKYKYNNYIKQKEEFQNIQNPTKSKTKLFLIDKITSDKYNYNILLGRMLMGSIKKGDELYICGFEKKYKIKETGIYQAGIRKSIEELKPGFFGTLIGIEDARSGNTISNRIDLIPFEKPIHFLEPIITLKIFPKKIEDLANLINALVKISKEDDSLKIKFDEKTGENLLMGMGELHLETTIQKLKNQYNLLVEVGNPRVLFKETIIGASKPFESKSPNGHNCFYISVLQMPKKIYEMFEKNKIPQGNFKRENKKLINEMVLNDLQRNFAKRIIYIEGRNMLIDATKGAQLFLEVMELVKKGFIETIQKGPVIKENLEGVLVLIEDIKIHVDPVHRGPTQIIPAIRNGILTALKGKGVTMKIKEPFQKINLEIPSKFLTSILKDIQNRRGVVENIEENIERNISKIQFNAPIKEMFGYSNKIRGLTNGKAIWTIQFFGNFEVSKNIQEIIIEEMRKIKQI